MSNDVWELSYFIFLTVIFLWSDLIHQLTPMCSLCYNFLSGCYIGIVCIVIVVFFQHSVVTFPHSMTKKSFYLTSPCKTLADGPNYIKTKEKQKIRWVSSRWMKEVRGTQFITLAVFFLLVRPGEDHKIILKIHLLM